MPVFRVEIDRHGVETTTYEIEGSSAENAERRIVELIESGDEPEPDLIEFHSDISGPEVDKAATRELPPPVPST